MISVEPLKIPDTVVPVKTKLKYAECQSLWRHCTDKKLSGDITDYIDSFNLLVSTVQVGKETVVVRDVTMTDSSGIVHLLFKEEKYTTHYRKFIYRLLVKPGPMTNTKCIVTQTLERTRSYSFHSSNISEYSEYSADNVLHGFSRHVHNYSYADDAITVVEYLYDSGKLIAEATIHGIKKNIYTINDSMFYMYDWEDTSEVGFKNIIISQLVKRTKIEKQFDVSRLSKKYQSLINTTISTDVCPIVLAELLKGVFPLTCYRTLQETQSNVEYKERKENNKTIEVTYTRPIKGIKSRYGVNDTMIFKKQKAKKIYKVSRTCEYMLDSGWEIKVSADIVEERNNLNFKRPGKTKSIKITDISIRYYHRTIFLYASDINDNSHLGNWKLFRDAGNTTLLEALAEFDSDPFKIDEPIISALVMKYSDLSIAEVKKG